MTIPSTTKRVVYSTIAGLGIFAGAAGIASAATGQSTPTTANHADTPERGDTADPAIQSSVTVVPEQAGTEQTDTAEAAQLASVATISEADANAAAIAKVPGTVAKTELEEENGSVVYNVEVKEASGAVTEVVVDAGNAAVLDQQAEGADDHGTDAGHEGHDGDAEANDD